MLDCRTASELLLTADPAELRGAGATDLARHVRTCAGCRARARLIVGEQARLDQLLSQVTARATLWSGAATPVARATTAPSRRQTLRHVVLPLAAAAALFLVVRQTAERAQGPLPPISLPPARVAEVPVVNAPAERNVAVMRTSNPNITVIWYY